MKWDFEIYKFRKQMEFQVCMAFHRYLDLIDKSPDFFQKDVRQLVMVSWTVSYTNVAKMIEPLWYLEDECIGSQMDSKWVTIVIICLNVSRRFPNHWPNSALWSISIISTQNRGVKIPLFNFVCDFLESWPSHTCFDYS